MNRLKSYNPFRGNSFTNVVKMLTVPRIENEQYLQRDLIFDIKYVSKRIKRIGTKIDVKSSVIYQFTLITRIDNL